MEKLKFTTRVLGPVATCRLKQHQITQTLRSYTDNVVQVILVGELKVNGLIKIILDNQAIGFVKWVWLDTPRWTDLSQADAEHGGFDNLADLEKALQRAGYRFRPIDKYRFYRIRFRWLEEVNDKAPLLQPA